MHKHTGGGQRSWAKFIDTPARVQREIMFAQATLNEIQRSGDTITLSSLPSQAGHVMHPGQDARLAAGQVDDKAAYTVSLITGSQRVVSEMKMTATSLQGEVKAAGA
ncbi:unnamed protein product [Pleuronectes platessa]|uniref:Uncharacterized protein n=1 Tax=Pleuronectes platessa TaxID=8262 RepID=A0A9N7YN67_PLEPL|nr:unnamed protein product [Pleuronectes platessa]